MAPRTFRSLGVPNARGHLRHGIHVYAKPPAELPSDLFVRKVSPRVFVIANES